MYPCFFWIDSEKYTASIVVSTCFQCKGGLCQFSDRQTEIFACARRNSIFRGRGLQMQQDVILHYLHH